MVTIQLVGDKSTVQYDLDEAPRDEFIVHHGTAYRASRENPLVWQRVEAGVPLGATALSLDGSVAPIAPHDFAPIDPPEPTDEPGDDAQPDQSREV